MAKLPSSQVIEIKYWYLGENNSLIYNDADGVGKTTFWIPVDEMHTALVSFGWPVRANAKSHIDKAVIVSNGHVQTLTTDLIYDFRGLKGKIEASGKTFNFDLEQKDIRVLKTFHMRHQNLQPLKDLLQGSPIKFIQPEL